MKKKIINERVKSMRRFKGRSSSFSAKSQQNDDHVASSRCWSCTPSWFITLAFSLLNATVLSCLSLFLLTMIPLHNFILFKRLSHEQKLVGAFYFSTHYAFFPHLHTLLFPSYSYYKLLAIELIICYCF